MTMFAVALIIVWNVINKKNMVIYKKTVVQHSRRERGTHSGSGQEEDQPADWLR